MRRPTVLIGIILPLSVMIVAVLVLRSGLGHPDSLCGDLRCFTINDHASYTLTELYADEPDRYRALWTAGDRRLRVDARVVPATAADEELRAETVRMKALYEKAPAPYPGDISDAVVCDPLYIPTYHEQKPPELSYFTGYLNDRLTFGSCSETEARYRGVMAFTYCPDTETLLRIEIIGRITDFASNPDAYRDALLSFSCRSK